MSKRRVISVTDMISWLRDKLIEDGYSVHDRYDEEPGLPIHLYCTKTRKEKDREKITESLIIITSTTKVTRDYFNKLCFCQFYLSLYKDMDPEKLKLILAIPNNAKIIEEEESKQKKAYNQESYEKQGFGLLKIKGHGDFKYIYEPITLRIRMEEGFKKEFDKSDKDCKAIARFFNKYIDEAVVGIAGEYPVKFEERNIDRKLLELITKLGSVTYATELKQIANEYLSYEKDDYSFAMEWVRKLWDKYFNIPYPDIHEKLEPLLKELYPKYREHFLHQFQVFLLGSIMINCLIRFGKLNVDKDTLSKGWLLAATFHDFAQAVQKYDDWNKNFFKESLKIDVLVSLELKKSYVEYTFSSSVEHIISSLGRCFCDFDEKDRTENYNKIRHFFYHQITDKKNHGLLSSLSLLKRFEKNGKFKNGEFHRVILPSATAIAIHDEEIWKALGGIIEESDEIEWIEGLCALKPLSKLKLDIQPLSFLLILCDNIQDWGRHFKDTKLEESFRTANVGLKSINFNGNRITIQLFVDFNSNSLDYLKYKVDTLKLVKGLLKASSPHFLIELWDRAKDEKLDMDVEIGD